MNSGKRASILIGVLLIITLAAGSLVPLLTPTTTTPPPIEPTDRPTPTFPVPITSFDGITFDQVYLHPTGLFTVGLPAGWLPGTPITEPFRAAITMNNNNALSVIEVSVEQPNTPITDGAGLSERFNAEYLDSSWVRYSDWTETQRVVEDTQVILDFNLTLSRQTYISRQRIWTDGASIYSVRVVTPSNAVELLRYLLDGMANSLQPLTQFANEPFNWTLYYDPQTRHAIRFPGEWTIADSAPGLPASITAPDGTTLRVEAAAGESIADEAAAEAWVMENSPGSTTILSVAAVENGDLSGYSVAYAFNTVDGEPRSGLALLLNGEERLHVANLRFSSAQVDLNAQREAVAAMLTALESSATPEAEATEAAPMPVTMDSLLVTVMDSFTVLPAINLAPDPNAPTPTPSPTIAPTEAVTEEAAEETTEAEATEVETEETAEAEATEADAEETAEAEATEAAE
jgi:hypothetical protein